MRSPYETPYENPYLEAFNTIPPPHENEWLWRGAKRYELVARYAWSVPTDQAIRVIAAQPDIVEMGAGTGYWASLVAAAGGRIRCYDLYQGEENEFRHRVQYYPIERRGVEVLRTDAKDCQTLLLSWPPYDDSFGHQCVRSFRGKWIVFIGEEEGGCTGDDKMFRRLRRDWKELWYVKLPQWPGMHDGMTVYERLPKLNTP